VQPLVNVRNVQEAILVLVLLVDGAHQSSSRWEDFVYEDEDGLLGAELDALADHVDELANGEVGWDEVLLLVDGCDVGLLDLLTDDLYMAVSKGSLWCREALMLCGERQII
jgi:hypothetical protein